MAEARLKRTVRLTARQAELADMLVSQLGESSFNSLVVRMLCSPAAVRAYEDEQRIMWNQMYAHMEQRRNPRRPAAKVPNRAKDGSQLADGTEDGNLGDDIGEEEWRLYAEF